MSTRVLSTPNLEVASAYTFNQLVQAFPASLVRGYPQVTTVDFGLVQWTGSAWVPVHPFVLGQSGLPFILPSSGSVGNNGAVTLTTALPRTYAACFMYFQSGALYAGSTPGFYYTAMSSTTVGTVYGNLYQGGQPLVPSTLTPIVATGPGAYTQLITGSNAVTAASFTLPGNTMGLNGQCEYRLTWQFPNNANSKQINTIFGGVNIAGDGETSATWRAGWHMVRNAGQTGVQTSFGSTSGDVGTGTAINSLAVDTTAGQACYFTMYMATATDFIVLESYSITVTPSATLDAQVTPSIFIPSPSQVPPGAAALGLTTNTWLAFPTAADVSFNLTDTSHKLYAGQYYNPNPPFSSSGGYLTTVTIGGNTYLSINQKGDGVNPGVATQNQSSVAGLLRSASASAGFYFEVASTCQLPNGFSTDNWPQIYINPIEHNSANGSSYPYVEFDIDEGFIFSLNSNNTFFGTCNSMVDWASGSGGSGTSTNNASGLVAGPNINRQIENIWGFSLDPVGLRAQWWLNGAKIFGTSISTQYASRIAGKHYSLIFGAGQHGANVPYSQLTRYIALWGG
jgi:hypothetical protein